MSKEIDVKSVQEEIDRLKSKSKEIEDIIHKLEDDKDILRDRMIELTNEIERIKYKGLTQGEYFEAVQGVEFEEDGCYIKLGSPYVNHIYVSYICEDKMELEILSSYNNKHGGVLNCVKRPNKNNSRYFEKNYPELEIPKARKKYYDKMVDIKNKYSNMVLNAEIEIPTKGE